MPLLSASTSMSPQLTYVYGRAEVEVEVFAGDDVEVERRRQRAKTSVLPMVEPPKSTS